MPAASSLCAVFSSPWSCPCPSSSPACLRLFVGNDKDVFLPSASTTASFGTDGESTLLRLTIAVMFIPSISPFTLPFTRACMGMVFAVVFKRRTNTVYHGIVLVYRIIGQGKMYGLPGFQQGQIFFKYIQMQMQGTVIYNFSHRRRNIYIAADFAVHIANGSANGAC